MFTKVYREESDPAICIVIEPTTDVKEGFLIYEGKPVHYCPSCNESNQALTISHGPTQGPTLIWCSCGAISVYDPSLQKRSLLEVYDFSSSSTPKDRCAPPEPTTDRQHAIEAIKNMRWTLYSASEQVPELDFIAKHSSRSSMDGAIQVLSKEYDNLVLHDGDTEEMQVVVSDGRLTQTSPEPTHANKYGIYRGNPPYTQSMLVESIDSLIFLKSTCLRLAEKHKNLWLIDRTDGDTTQVVKDGTYIGP